MVINRELGRKERHEEFGEEIGLQQSLKERKGRGLELFYLFFYFFYIVISVEGINKIETLYQCSITYT